MQRRREPLPTRVEGTAALPFAYDEAIRRGLADLGLELEAGAQAIIDGHVRLLLAWTRAINLTAIRDPADVALRHVVDSLTATLWLGAHGVARLLDLGSGGGFPGLPLAAALPGLEVTLLEPITKKARFLTVAREALGLASRVAVDNRRAEALASDDEHRAAWPVVAARAIGTTAELVELAFPLLTGGGSLLAWKRGDLDVELASARRAIADLGGGTIEVLDVRVDGLPGHRLVVATRATRGRVPAAYPRDPAVRRRRPW